MQQPKPLINAYAIDIFLIIFTLGSLFFILLGVRPLFIPEEGRYAEITREMIASNDYITPYLNGIKYFEKPALFYWLAAAAVKIGGLNLWSLRSVNGLLALFGCIATYITANKLYDRLTGLLAAFILGTSLLYFLMAHMVSLDLTITTFLTISLYAFLLSTQTNTPVKHFYFYSAFVAAAFAVLAKGLIGIIFPILIIGMWITLLNEWRILKLRFLLGMFIFLLIAAPWHILVGVHNPEFFYFYFIEQHFLRYTLPEIGHHQPVWFFIPALMIGFFPWIVFLPQALIKSLPSWNKRFACKTELFFLIWAGLIFVFFSFSKSKLYPYILPIFPPLAILTARYLTHCYLYKLTLRLNYIALWFFALSIASVLFLFPDYLPVYDYRGAKLYLTMASLILLIGTSASVVYAYRDNFKALGITIFTTYFFLLFLLTAVPHVDTRTTLPLVLILRPLLQPQDEVITYNQYYQDLPFYLKRQVNILNWRNELTYGMQHQPQHEWLIDDDRFWQKWRSSKRVFVIIGTNDFQDLKNTHPHEKIYELGKTKTNVLFSNK